MAPMDSLTPDALLAKLQWRYATKQFDPGKKIPTGVWAALEQSLVLTPSSYGLQPWKFLVVTDPAVKEALVPASWNQAQPAQCSHHVVFATRTRLGEAEVSHYLDQIAATRGVPLDSLLGFRKLLNGFAERITGEGWAKEWATRQVYIALGNFMTSCAVLGVDACPMEGIKPEEYDQVLGLEGTDFKTVVACAAGYRASGDKYAEAAKVRFPASEVIQHL